MEASALSAPAALPRLKPAPLLRLRGDDQLLALFRQGDDEAFQAIYDRYRQRIFAYTRQMLAGSRADAEDAMQDVFLRAFDALRESDREIALRPWLYRVAHNRCVDQLRRSVPAPEDVLQMARAPLRDPIAECERRADLKQLVADVRGLPDQQRSALLMREIDGLSYEELAGALEVTVPAVKSLLVRARLGLVEATEARSADCGEIRADLASAHGRGVRMSGRARRHLRECSGCRGYRTAMRRLDGGLQALNPPGVLGGALKLLGLGGAGSGLIAASSGPTLGAGALATGTKIAAIACCTAAVAGGASEVRRIAHHQPAHPAATRSVVAPAGEPAIAREPRAPTAASTGGVVAEPAPAEPPAPQEQTERATGGVAAPQAQPAEPTPATTAEPHAVPAPATAGAEAEASAAQPEQPIATTPQAPTAAPASTTPTPEP